MEITPDIDYPCDTEEAKETYMDILDEGLSDTEKMQLYNTILATAQLLAGDLGYEVTMPYAGYPSVYQ